MLTAAQINLLTASFTGLTALTSVLVLWATFRVTRATEASVGVMRAQQRAMSRPYVDISVYARAGTTMLMLAIRNTGTSAAENLRLVMDRDIFFNAEEGSAQNFRGYPAFKDTISAFGPRSELRFNLGNGSRVLQPGFDTLCPKRFSVTAIYSFAGKQVSETTTLDLSPFGKTAAHSDPAVEQLRRIADHSEKLVKLLDDA